MLHTEPSFSIYSTDDKFGDEVQNEDLIKEKPEKSATIGETFETQFSFGSNSMRIIEEDDDEEEKKDRGLNQFKDLGESGPSNSDNDGDLDNYYSKLVQEDPSNPLVLRNYAQYLESKRDFSGAEEYYYRATLADPKDGEILSQYAKLVWEIHGDQAKASDYFEKAVRAAPENSNVVAAYASFMWRIDDESDEEESWSNNQADENSVMVEKRPSSPPRNPSSMRNYARFLHQSKGDHLNGAEEYYARAILEDPNDGQMLSLYASILWQLHGDKDRAVAYFERAVIATPEDSDVLAAYAKFLWETDAEEDAQEVGNVF